MGQLFHRLSQLVKAELNHANSEIDTDNYSNATVFAATGGVVGASIGKIGVLAKGTGYSIGAVPLTAAGTLTGLALYEAIRVVVEGEGDTSSVGAAAIGAAAGAVVSATIGGVGVAAGGTAISVSMAAMAATGAVVGLGIASLNQLLQQGIDPEKLLDLAIEDMQEELVKLRQALIPVMAVHKRTLQQYEHAQANVKKWQRRALLAVRIGNDHLARQALEQKKIFVENAKTLKVYLDEQTALVDRLKPQLVAVESKIAEAKVFKAQMRAAKSQAEVQNTVSRLNGSKMLFLERMEEEVLLEEAHTKSAAELAGIDLESQFAALESSREIDDEL